MMFRILFFLCVTITCCQFCYAQDGPFKFDGKTDVFIGNGGHWKAVQDAQTNLLWTSSSARYFMINNTAFLQNGNVGIGTTNPVAKLNMNGGAIRLTNSSGYPLGVKMLQLAILKETQL